MANYQVNTGGTIAAAGAAKVDPPGAQQGGGASDVSHLRPLSEGVLRAAGLHGGVDSNGTVRDLRGAVEGAFDLDPETLPSTETHVQWMKLERATGGVITRDVNADGTVVLRLVYGDGDVTTARGANTVEAFHALSDKMNVQSNNTGGAK